MADGDLRARLVGKSFQMSGCNGTVAAFRLPIVVKLDRANAVFVRVHQPLPGSPICPPQRPVGIIELPLTLLGRVDLAPCRHGVLINGEQSLQGCNLSSAHTRQSESAQTGDESKPHNTNGLRPGPLATDTSEASMSKREVRNAVRGMQGA